MLAEHLQALHGPRFGQWMIPPDHQHIGISGQIRILER
jgi:hypothetical protein